MRKREILPTVKQRRASKYDYLVGSVIGNRKVLSSMPRSLFEVECLVCGHISAQRGVDLEKIKTRKCVQCILNNRDANVTHVYNRVKNNAKNRKIEWSLTIDDFKQIASMSCFYCGINPIKTNSLRDRSPYYHGLDRVNNALGYTKRNSVSCCPICNYAKHDLSIEEFEVWLSRCYTNTILKKKKI